MTHENSGHRTTRDVTMNFSAIDRRNFLRGSAGFALALPSF